MDDRLKCGRRYNIYCNWCPFPEEPRRRCAIAHIDLFLETIIIIGLHLAANSLIFFLVSSVKLCYFCTSEVSAVQDTPRSLTLVPIEIANASSY